MMIGRKLVSLEDQLKQVDTDVDSAFRELLEYGRLGTVAGSYLIDELERLVTARRNILKDMPKSENAAGQKAEGIDDTDDPRL